MKHLILLFFPLITFLAAKCQVTPPLQKQYQGAPNTIIENRGFIQFDSGHVNAHYTDTATANLGRISQIPFSEIVTNDSLKWLRNSTHTKWFLQGGGNSAIPLVVPVASVTVMRTLNPTDTSILYYLYQYGKEGFWRYSSTDVTSTDNTGMVLVTSGGKRFKRSITDGILQADWFNVFPDGSQFSRVGVDTAFAYYKRNQTTIRSINFSPSALYAFDDTLAKIDFPCTINGSGGTTLRWYANKGGMKLFSAAVGNIPNFYVNHIRFKQVFSNEDYRTANAAKEVGLEFTGILYMKDCAFENWQGHGTVGHGNGSDVPPTSIDLSHFTDCEWTGNRGHGIVIYGADANPTIFENCSFRDNGGTGWNMNGFLGGSVKDCHADSNSSPEIAYQRSLCTFIIGTDTLLFYAKHDGDYTGTTAGFLGTPSLVSNDWGLFPSQLHQWVHSANVLPYRADSAYLQGGSYRGNLNTGGGNGFDKILDCYAEANQPPAGWNSKSEGDGGDLFSGGIETGLYVHPFNNLMEVYTGYQVRYSNAYPITQVRNDGIVWFQSNIDNTGIVSQWDTTYHWKADRDYASYSPNSPTAVWGGNIVPTSATLAASLGRTTNDFTGNTINPVLFFDNASVGGRNYKRLDGGTAFPTSGSYMAGDYRLNVPSSANSNILGWRLATDGTGAWDTMYLAPVGGGANRALSNLLSVAINTALLPGSDGSYNIGSLTKQWNTLYMVNAGGGVNFSTITLTGSDATNSLSISGNLKIVAAGNTTTSAVTVDATQTIKNKTNDNTNSYTIKDGSLIFQNTADITKQGIFDFSTITTATTRTYTFPNKTGTLATLNGTQTWTGTQTYGAGVFTATTPNFITGFTIGGSATSRKIIVGDGTNFVASTETWATPGTSGNVLTSDGNNWTSAAPSGGGGLNQQMSNMSGTVAANLTIKPGTDNSINLGSSTKQFATLYLGEVSSGDEGKIMWNAGESVIAKNAGAILSVTGSLKVLSPTNTANSVVTIDGTQTLSAKTATSLKLETSSTVGYVWTATGTGGQGGWAAASGITIGTTTITSGTNNRVLYQSAGVVSQSANFTFDGNQMVLAGSSTPLLDITGSNATDVEINLRASNTTSEAALYLQNQVGGYGAYGVLAYSGSTKSGTIFGNSRQDAVILLSGGASAANVVGMQIGTVVNTSLVFGTNGSERARFKYSGEFGLGVTAPTAILHLKAGTTAASTAPLKFNSGTAMTTPEDGAMEYHSSHLYFTIGSTRYQLDQQSAGSGANTALSNLASVSINTSLLAQTGVDLGSTTAPFRFAYIWGTGTFSSTSIKITGVPTGNRTFTLPDFDGTAATLAGTESLSNKTLVTPVLGVATGTSLVLSSFLNEAKGADIASAGTTDIGAATGNYVNVTGTSTITALGTVQAGTRRIVQFSGALTLTHNASSLILPGAANITTVAGDVATFVSLGSGNWKCVNYQITTRTGTGSDVLSVSPTFTGSPIAPTQTQGDNSTKIATTAYVDRHQLLVVSATSASSLTINADITDIYCYTALAANLTINAPTGTLWNGQTLMLRITPDATPRTLTWNSIFRASSDLALPTTTTASKTIYLMFSYNSTATKWDFISSLDNFFIWPIFLVGFRRRKRKEDEYKKAA